MGGAGEPTRRPDSVGVEPYDPILSSHPSWRLVTDTLMRPTRRLGRAALPGRCRSVRLRGSPERVRRPFLVLLQVGFTQPPRSPGALVVSYTTVSPLPAPPFPESRPLAVCLCGTFPRVTPVDVPTTLPCGVRTFLDLPSFD